MYVVTFLIFNCCGFDLASHRIASQRAFVLLATWPWPQASLPLKSAAVAPLWLNCFCALITELSILYMCKFLVLSDEEEEVSICLLILLRTQGNGAISTMVDVTLRLSAGQPLCTPLSRSIDLSWRYRDPYFSDASKYLQLSTSEKVLDSSINAAQEGTSFCRSFATSPIFTSPFACTSSRSSMCKSNVGLGDENAPTKQPSWMGVSAQVTLCYPRLNRFGPNWNRLTYRLQ